MSITALAVQDMHCTACAQKLAASLRALPDVRDIKFNELRRHVIVDHDDTLQTHAIIGAIEGCGYHPSLLSNANTTSSDRTLLMRLGIAGLAAMQVMMVHIALYAGMASGISASYERILEFTALLFCIPVVSFSALPFYINGLVRLRRGLNMDTPIAIAILVAFGTSFHNTLVGAGDIYYDSVVMFAFLMLGARYLDQRLRLKLQLEDDILSGLPQESVVREDGRWQTVPAPSVKPGQILRVDEGAQLTVDGVLQDPGAMLDEATLTGESEWCERRRGDQLYAGTFNRGPALTMKATSSMVDSKAAQIERLANTALDKKNDLVRLADRVARVFVPTILALAFATFVVWSLFDESRALSAALAVLVISCPCALSLAIPAAISAALSRLRQAGILVKRTSALERVAHVDTVYLDKTGTLTAPTPEVTGITTLGETDAAECLWLASALQAYSSHPLASAFLHSNRTAEDVQITSNQGIAGTVDGRALRIGTASFCGCGNVASASRAKNIFLSIDAEPAAIFHISQPLRADARPTIDRLRRAHLAVSMISGDDEAHCAEAAETLGIDFRAEQTPRTKAALIDPDKPAMFVGDGMNDMPALASASVSVATMETNDLVKSKADIALLTRRLSALVDLFVISSHTRTVMKQNLGWAVGYNVVAIPLAALGFAPPWVAAIGMSLSSIIVMLNAMRILRTPSSGAGA